MPIKNDIFCNFEILVCLEDISLISFASDSLLFFIFKYMYSCSDKNKHNDPMFSLQKLIAYTLLQSLVQLQKIFNFGKKNYDDFS